MVESEAIIKIDLRQKPGQEDISQDTQIKGGHVDLTWLLSAFLITHPELINVFEISVDAAKKFKR